MARLEIAFDELRRLSTRYTEGAIEIDEILKMLRASTEPLLLDWVGSTSGAFRVRSNDIDDAHRRLVTSLQNFGTMLSHAADAYESTNDDISGAFDL